MYLRAKKPLKNPPRLAFKKSSTTKVGDIFLVGIQYLRYGLYSSYGWVNVENKHEVYRSQDCMKKFRKSLREHAIKITNFEKKEIIPLTNEKLESQKKTKICYISQKKLEPEYTNDKDYHKVKDHCHYTGKYRCAAYSICNLKYSIPKGIAVVFHNGSNYNYHFIIKQLVKEFKGELNCLGENNEKYKTFSVIKME